MPIAVDRTVGKQQKLMMLLAMVAGFCDAYGLQHFKTYVSFMSGNTTQAGIMLAGSIANSILPLTAVLLFAAGILVAALLDAYKYYAKRWMPFVSVALIILLCATAEVYFKLSNLAGTAILSFAMGYLNNTLMHIGNQSVNPDFVTGNLNAGVRHFAAALLRQPMDKPQGVWDTHKYRAMVLLSIWICFLAGAFCYATTTFYIGNFAIALPIIALLSCPIYSYKNPSILN